MSYNHHLPKGKVSLKPKRHHGFQVLLFFLGWLLPPLAVAARFGIGRDVSIACVLTLCGYIPGHGHNFYIQNIRNNSNKARTPKWAIRYGLVDPSNQQRRAQKSAWSKRYDERLPESTLVGQELADGEEGPNWDATRSRQNEQRRSEGLWDREDERYYNEDEAPNQRNWHYPANFEGAVGDGRSKRRQQVESGDRWERTRSATNDGDSYGSYPPGGTAATDDDVPEWGRDYGRRKNSTGGRNKKYSNNSYDDSSSIDSRDQQSSRQQQQQKKSNNPDDVFNHEF
ncbi:hypothetical protein VHUM_01313 [Vanrija humicola]|uniref:Uncharacterized protein n=1 Tax=Vanrija humicola TaxID=5417 RepID=A0A7D8Z4V9_VANHU|nr:hypothetical protein VHUM_01313 [Vanrija humicola]